MRNGRWIRRLSTCLQSTSAKLWVHSVTSGRFLSPLSYLTCFLYHLLSFILVNCSSQVPRGLPYFAVDFGLQGGFAHVIENEQKFPHYFGKVSVCITAVIFGTFPSAGPPWGFISGKKSKCNSWRKPWFVGKLLTIGEIWDCDERLYNSHLVWHLVKPLTKRLYSWLDARELMAQLTGLSRGCSGFLFYA